MAPPSRWQLYRAIYAAITGVQASLDALVENGGTCAVVDKPLQDGPFPFVSIGEVDGEPDDTKFEDANSDAIDVHVWSRFQGRKESQRIMDLIAETLHRNTSLAISGADLTLSTLEAHIPPRLDPDGQTYHGTLVFRILYSET